jgi:zinc/manganese transport system substrate-binding protein
MLKRALYWGLAAAVALGLAGPAWAEPVRVVASFSILGDITREIGGDQVAVTTLVGPGGDAHVYQPSPADARAVAAAELIVVNGLGFEGWFDRLFATAGGKARVVTASTGLVAYPIRSDRASGHDHHDHGAADSHGQAVDPHAWQDLDNGRRYVATIAAALAEAAPDRAALFAERAAAYDRRLARLSEQVRAELSAIPRSRRKIITNHDALGYFGRAYGVDILSPIGISTEAEPTARAVAALIRQMKRDSIRAVFIEGLSDPRLITQIARDGGGVIGGTLYADTLSPPDGPAPTYEAMIRHTASMLVTALSAK